MPREAMVHHWKHGWIPLTRAAALSKAHGSSTGADRLLHGGRSDVHAATGAPAGRLAPGDRVETTHRGAKVVGVVTARDPGEHAPGTRGVTLHTPDGVTVRREESKLRRVPDAPGPVDEARRFGAAANAGQRANITEAQAKERAAARRRVKPVQGELFGGHGELQGDLFAVAGEPAAKRESTRDRIRRENAARPPRFTADEMDQAYAAVDRRYPNLTGAERDAKARRIAALMRQSQRGQSWTGK